MKNKIKIYLDWNVIAAFLDENFKWLEDIIFSNREYISIPFSSEHVDEATNIKLSNRLNTKNEIDRRLLFI
jgi:type IV secretory pathway TrbL component